MIFMFIIKEMSKYYSDDVKFVWNGNEIEPQNRQAFQLELADSQHNVESYDVHPIFSKFRIWC